MDIPPLEEAKSLIAKGDIDGATQLLSVFLNGDFFHAEALFMLGGCLMAKGMNGVGAVLTSAAIDARSVRGRGFPEGLLNLGGMYKSEHMNDMAAKVWADALEQESLPKERSKIMSNISGLYINEGQPKKAIEWCRKALAENPRNHGAYVNLGMAQLELGHWREGWEGWAHSFPSGDRHQRSYEGVPVWDGSPGKTVIVWGDQGVGDEIFYACCLADMAKVCKRVIFDCHPRLELLFKRSFPDIDVYGTRKDLSELQWVDGCGAEAAICIADLPQHFRNTDASWGDGAAYLKAAPAIKSGSGMRIGISWTGGTKRTRIDLRSLPLQDLLPILEAAPDAQWFSLQYTPDAARQVCELEEETGIRISHFPGWVEHFDYDRTASFAASLDLVITVCTTIHHLAGSLGVPVWTLTPSRPSWRYQLKGDTLPWYKSARMFRQAKDGDWAGPVQRVADELADLAGISSGQRRVA